MALFDIVEVSFKLGSTSEVSLAREVHVIASQIIMRQFHPCLALLLGLLVNTKVKFIGFGEKIETVVIITYDCVMSFILAFSEFIGGPLIV